MLQMENAPKIIKSFHRNIKSNMSDVKKAMKSMDTTLISFDYSAWEIAWEGLEKNYQQELILHREQALASSPSINFAKIATLQADNLAKQRSLLTQYKEWLPAIDTSQKKVNSAMDALRENSIAQTADKEKRVLPATMRDRASFD
jgi:hypothetical protein